MSEPCPACKKLDGEINHPPGQNYVGWGVGWQPCLACKGTGLVQAPRSPLLNLPICETPMDNVKTFTIEISVPAKRIAELLCAGFEGAPKWCQIVKYINLDAVEYTLVGGGYSDLPVLGGVVICRDVYADGAEGRKALPLDGASVLRGLKAMQEKAPRHFANFLQENEDAETGDVFLQFCLLGEIVYG